MILAYKGEDISFYIDKSFLITVLLFLFFEYSYRKTQYSFLTKTFF